MASDQQILLVDALAQVVDSIRQTGVITGQSFSNGVYTLTVTFDENDLKYSGLTDKEVLEINSNDYIITVIDDNTFSIEADSGLTFVGESWKSLAPYYEHGHPVEIVHTLNKKNNDIYAFKKYPLIILLQDFESSINVDNTYLFSESTPNLAIVNFTQKTIKAAERYDLNYRNVLYPIYFDFIEAMENSEYFSTMPDKGFNHTLVEALYYGASTENGNTANKMTDPLDALLLNNADLKLIKTTC